MITYIVEAQNRWDGNQILGASSSFDEAYNIYINPPEDNCGATYIILQEWSGLIRRDLMTKDVVK